MAGRFDPIGLRPRPGLRRAQRAALAVGLTLQAGTASAAAWTLQQGQGQTILTFFHTLSTRSYGPGRSLSASPDYSKSELYALIEYGLTDRLTLIFTPSLQDIHSDPNGAEHGLGYTDLGLRYRVVNRGGWVGSVQGIVRLPQGGTSSTQAQISDTDVQYDLRALLGRGFKIGRRDAFVDLEAGYRLRMGAPPGEVHLDLTLGYRAAPALQLLAQSFTTVSAGAGAGSSSYDYTKVQLSAAYDLTPATTVQFGAVATVAGRNALRERGLFLGVWHRF